jgi:putative endopeptidase
MKKITFIPTLFVCCIILSSCNNKSNTEPPIIASNLDSTVKPADDFYAYVNNIWKKQNPLRDEYSRFGRFDALQEKNNEMVRKLIEELSTAPQPEGSEARMIGDFYASGMDSAAIEKAGTQPLEEEFNRIDKISSLNGILDEVAYLQNESIFPLFNLFADQDSKNSKKVIAIMMQGGLGMNDRDYYTSDDARSQELRQAYLIHLQKIFELTGIDSVTAKARALVVMNIETRLAKASFTRLELRDPVKNYNKMSLADLQKLSPAIDWKRYFVQLGVANPGDINVMQPIFFKEVSNILNDFDVESWKTYLRWHYVNSMSEYLSSAFVAQNFDFYGKTFTGSKQIKPRWKRMLASTNEALGMAVGKMYVEKYFPAKAKERMLELVANLKVSLSARIQELDWMSDTTKQKAHEKLNAINVKIGYPDKWRDYSGLKIDRLSFFMNAVRSNRFNMKYMLSKINKPVDPTDWLMTPQTVNAYYNPNMNEICFPAAILQPPFFFLEADDAVNYGAIGVVIGHEITHGFDDEGRMYDKDGNLNEWWTPADAQRFKARAEVLVQQFNEFKVLDTLHANGSLTLGENIADLGGLNISFYALKEALKNKPAVEKIDGFTPEQRFFIAYAQVWGQNIRDKEIMRRTKEDVHSVGRFRVNGPLPNMPEFTTAFGFKPGDKMYLDETKRAFIW